MEPTIQSTIQQQPTGGNQTAKFITILIVGFVGLVGAVLVANNTFTSSNRAETSKLVCRDDKTGAGQCIVDGISSITDPVVFAKTFVVATEVCPLPAGNRTIIHSLKDYVNPAISKQFDIKNGCEYKCEIKFGDNAVDGTVCMGTELQKLACEGPTITPPCPDCVDGTIACEGPKASPLKAGKVASCPALAVHNVKYTDFSGNACSNQTPSKLDCATDEVWIESTQDPAERRKLTKTECDLFKSGSGYDIRLHTALGETCREYEVQIYRNGVRFDELCEDCKLKSGCPVACEAPVELTKADLVDISYVNTNKPEIKLSGTETVKCGIVPNSNPEINCELDINQNSCGKQVVFTPRANGTIYLDDQYNNVPRIVIDAVKDVSIPFTYENAGHYDVVFSCGDPNKNDIKQVCAKRITVACGGGGGGGDNPTPAPSHTPTPTQPISCPEVPLEGVCI